MGRHHSNAEPMRSNYCAESLIGTVLFRVLPGTSLRNPALTNFAPKPGEEETIFAVRLGVRAEQWHFGSHP